MPTVAEKAADDPLESPARHVRLFRNGANQAVRIPKEFELPGKDAIMRREGDRLIIEPTAVKAQTLAELMKDWENIDEPFPDVDAGLLPLDDIDL
ncbi:MAG: AbrB/MazE/SpoVT family DNA-binding domain-containing protein [Rhodoferax sp.]|nr:AbrB/MazE/SpoVT family DNA-binding domain-containing protein [Rhodoferax sp.]